MVTRTEQDIRHRVPDNSRTARAIDACKSYRDIARALRQDMKEKVVRRSWVMIGLCEDLERSVGCEG